MRRRVNQLVAKSEELAHARATGKTPRVVASGDTPITWEYALSVSPCQLEDVMMIEPGALGKAFFPGFFGDAPPKYERVGSVGVVTIDGPLMQHGGWFWDGYSDIRDRFSAAMGDEAVRSVVLQINSPGGMCAGCFEAVNAMLTTKQATGKPVIAFADEMAASAAYAIASVADEIWLPQSGRVGSVGTVITLVDQTKMLDEIGIRVEVITTGAHKADGHPAVALTDPVIARFKAVADHLNEIFVGQVAAARHMTPSDVLKLEAAMFSGKKAVDAGLADAVGSFEQAVARAEKLGKMSAPSAPQGATAKAPEESDMPNENESPVDGTKGRAAFASLAMLAAIFGLAATANEQAVQDRARGLADAERELLRVTGKETLAEAIGTVKAWKESAGAAEGLRKELDTLRAKDTEREVAALITEGKDLGKITNDKLESVCRETGARSIVELKSLIAALPAVGGGVLKKDQTTEAEGAVTLTDEDKVTAKQLGLSLEEMAKTKREALAQKGS